MMFIFGMTEIIVGSILLVLLLLWLAGRSTLWVLDKIGTQSMMVGWPIFAVFLLSYSSAAALVAYQVVV